MVWLGHDDCDLEIGWNIPVVVGRITYLYQSLIGSDALRCRHETGRGQCDSVRGRAAGCEAGGSDGERNVHRACVGYEYDVRGARVACERVDGTALARGRGECYGERICRPRRLGSSRLDESHGHVGSDHDEAYRQPHDEMW